MHQFGALGAGAEFQCGATRRSAVREVSAGLDDATLAIEVADRLDELLDRVAFDGSQVRIPDVDDQDDAGLLAAVPRFMFERVVEGDATAFLPGMVLAADTDRAVIRNDQRQVRDDARIRHAVMRQDVRSWREYREADLRRVRADAHQRQRFDNRRGARTARMVVVMAHAMAIKEERVPG